MAGLFGWGARRPAVTAPPEPAPEPRMATKVLPKLLAALAPVDGPALLNLGPVVGQNIAFFGDRLACKISIEDLFLHVDQHAAGGGAVALGDVLEARLPNATAKFDGILCWDLFDFLDKTTSQRLARRLVTLLRPGGVLYGFFGTVATDVTEHTRYIVEAADAFRLRVVGAPRLKRHVIVNRDLNRMFEGLEVAESILLKTCTRETLFRKAG